MSLDSLLRRFVDKYRREGIVSAISKATERLYTIYIRALWSKKRRQTLCFDDDVLFDFDVGNDDIVFDIGGYQGNYTERLLRRHSPERVHIFEPVPEFTETISQKFSDTNTVKVHQYGLSDSNRIKTFNIDGASSSSHSGDNDTELKVRDVCEVIDEIDVDKIRIMKMNVEGEEYAILNRLIDTGYIERIQDIPVQFHYHWDTTEFKPEYDEITSKLAETHTQTLRHDLIWQNWSRNQSVSE
ncbi:FkbM family methyltransferase [Halosimplex amylolyticum]|uniref:FkbM family methyltransferase n=1 Tax=Halosimplex amylolyticum TaxID=3396616 RepID=UPI003F56F94F